MWVLIDNYDSFTYILHHYLLLAANGIECRVIKNDELTLDELIQLHPQRIIISPGPETPQKAGITMDVVRHFYDKLPILGVCLGHQALGLHFGAQLIHASYPMHGKVTSIRHQGHAIFHNIPEETDVMRYHSLILSLDADSQLKTIAATDDGVCMAICHEQYPLLGLQFHPESVGTPYGQQMINNWAAMY